MKLAVLSGLDMRSVQRCLVRTAERGWIRLEHDGGAKDDKDQRRITLLWRREGFVIPGPVPEDSGVAQGGDTSVRGGMTPVSGGG